MRLESGKETKVGRHDLHVGEYAGDVGANKGKKPLKPNQFHSQYFGEVGEARGEVGEYLGDVGDPCMGATTAVKTRIHKCIIYNLQAGHRRVRKDNG